MKRKSARSQIKDQTEESVVTLAGNKKQFWGSPGGSDGTEYAFNAGDLDLIPGSGRPWNNIAASSVKASLKMVHIKKKKKKSFKKVLKKKKNQPVSCQFETTINIPIPRCWIINTPTPSLSLTCAVLSRSAVLTLLPHGL